MCISLAENLRKTRFLGVLAECFGIIKVVVCLETIELMRDSRTVSSVAGECRMHERRKRVTFISARFLRQSKDG